MSIEGAARVQLFVGNWKMNVSVQKAQSLARKLRAATDRDVSTMRGCEVIIAPPLLAIPDVSRELAVSSIKIAAQNMHWESKGAFTGEVSATMLREFEVSYVLVGHSERRNLFHEDDKRVNLKIKAALAHRIMPILCIGERADERDAGRVVEVVLGQLQRGLDGLESAALGQIVIAYEPVWAVGSGRTAQPREVDLVLASIRSALRDRHGRGTAESIRIIYGGSVTPANAAAFASRSNLDGLIIGAASLEVDSFIKILHAAKPQT
jgi:triosephosphate isomerase (TIM)